MNIWFLISIVLYSMSLGEAMANHGKPRDNTNAWITLLSFVLNTFLMIMAIRHGGF